jgi:hypothetical protein
MGAGLQGFREIEKIPDLPERTPTQSIIYPYAEYTLPDIPRQSLAGYESTTGAIHFARLRK